MHGPCRGLSCALNEGAAMQLAQAQETALRLYVSQPRPVHNILRYTTSNRAACAAPGLRYASWMISLLPVISDCISEEAPPPLARSPGHRVGILPCPDLRLSLKTLTQ